MKTRKINYRHQEKSKTENKNQVDVKEKSSPRIKLISGKEKKKKNVKQESKHRR